MPLISKLVTFLLFAFVIVAAPAEAQLVVPKTETGDASSGLELLIDEARKDGSTIVVISPNNDDANSNAAASNMRAEMFLKVRNRVKEITQSSPQLIPNLKGTLKAASPDGTWFWLLRALGTAVLGLVIGWYATRPIVKWSFDNVPALAVKEPQTTADKIAYLLSRALFALVYVVIYFAVAMVVAVVLDSGHEPSRRAIFEVVAWYCVYRFLRHGVSWNIFAGDMPKFRLVNLTDSEAVKLHTHWHIGVAIFATYTAFARFASITGQDQIAAGMTGREAVERMLGWFSD